MDEALVKALLGLLDGLEETVRRVKEELKAYIERETQWSVINAPKPVSPDDRAIKWLEGRLKTVKEKHPGIQFEFLRNPEGLITGLRYRAEDEETRADIEAPAKWAFERAAERPVPAQSRG